MPDARRARPDNPAWAYTSKGKVIPCPKGLPPEAVLSCREGDAAWSHVAPMAVVVPRPVAASGPTLYDESEVR